MANTFTNGSNMAAQRSLLRALGWSDSEMNKPIVGIVSAQSEIIPGHIHLGEIARAVADGVLWCLLKSAKWQSYLCYGLGNAFIALLLLMTRFMGKERIAGKWYFSALFVTCGWVAVMLGRSLVGLCAGYSFGELLRNFCLNELLSLFMAVVIICVMRKLDGMFEDQKSYLARIDGERRDKAHPDAFGASPVEMDEESMSILKRWDDNLS